MSDQDFKNHNARGDHLPAMSEVIAETANHESDAIGHWGKWGGQFVPEAPMTVIGEVVGGYAKVRVDQDFLDEPNRLQCTYIGRPSPLYCVEKFSADIDTDVWLKHEDLNHTGSHKINNVLDQVLLTKRMGKKNIIAETGTDQHGVAAATVCALLGLNCRTYMGKIDVIRQRLNIAHMRLLGAEVIEVEIGSKTLEGAIDGTIHFWVSHADDTYCRFGTATGPHPLPTMVCGLQHIINAEARQQILAETGSLPDAVVAYVSSGSNAIGAFHHFIDDELVRLIGAEAGGGGIGTGRHAVPISAAGNPGVFQGSFAILMQNEDGQVTKSHSISVGLNYPGVNPEHSYLADIGRTSYLPVADTQAMQASQDLTRIEGILPAIESAHAVVTARLVSGDLNGELGRKPLVIVSASSRGNKDVNTAAKWFSLVEES